MNFDELLKSFKVQPDLEHRIWMSDNKLDPKVRKALLHIATHFYEGIDLENKPPIKDIVFTGSLANYNYSKFSDIDIHLLFDFSQYGDMKEVFEQYFLMAKSNWNNKHDITIKGYDVEIYAEDENNPHHSTGVYSIQNDEWIKMPEKVSPIFDGMDVKSKLKYFIDTYKQITASLSDTDVEEALEKVEALRDKIVKFRQGGLERGGEYSTENVTFKALRRIGYLDRLADLKNHLTDQKLSVENLWECTYE